MIYKRLKLILCVATIGLVEVSSTLFDIRLFDLNSGGFSRERSQLSRNTSIRSINSDNPPLLDFIGLVGQFGYPGEEHQLTTVDGYNIKIHRIPGSKAKPKSPGKPVVFFQHGLFASSDTWVLLGPKKDLSYALVDAGYDVWLGNARGNTYSRSHNTLDPDTQPEFWQFSFHEIALYDVTAAIDYILETTGQSQILYIGHSMGTTISYILLSKRPEYNQKIWLVVSLAPVAYWNAQPKPLTKFLMDNSESLKSLAHNTRVYEIFPLTAGNQILSKRMCRPKSVFRDLCMNFYFFASGYNPDQLVPELLPYLLSYIPAGASAKTLIHFSQNMVTGEFREFDYGTSQNYAKYGRPKPPPYNLKKITAPVALFYGGGDAIVAPGNPVQLSKVLPNVVRMEALGDERFSHLDFLWAKDVRKLVTNRVLNVIAEVLRRKYANNVW